MFLLSTQPELATCWSKMLTKENIIKKYLPSGNCQERSPPLINFEVKRASSENSVRRYARIAQFQQQVGATAYITCFSVNHRYAKKERRWLFESDLNTTLKTVQELEKSSEQLAVPKKNFRHQQGNLKRPFLSREGAQHSGQNHRVTNSDQRSFLPAKYSQHRTGKQNRWSLSAIPKQMVISSEPQRSKKKHNIISTLIKELVKDRVICPKTDHFICNIFTVPKPD
nr:unnamed protein product [Callosobruchus chinensis]